MNPSSRRKSLVALGVFFLLLSLSLCWLLFSPPSRTSLTKVIYIKKGTPLKKISAILEQEGIIRDRHFFAWIARALGNKANIKAGEYEFHTQMLPLEVMDILVKGQVKLHLVTIAEGYTLSQIVQLLGELSIVDSQAFVQKASAPDFISTLGLPADVGPTLEGYLFPDTYHLYRGMEPEEVIQMMVHQFKRVFNSDLVDRSSQSGITPREAVILASIIEKETSLPEEKPLISAVFHNRLKKGMPLQSDPTVIYGIKNFNGNLTREDLLRRTPYNTYLSVGLPPTPICNPGKDSILAALSPASVPYLYFVSRNDGAHHFSSDLEGHNQAVWRYQKYPPKK